jgi:hypothetical protein
VNTPGKISALMAVNGIRFKNFFALGPRVSLSSKNPGKILGIMVTSIINTDKRR